MARYSLAFARHRQVHIATDFNRGLKLEVGKAAHEEFACPLSTAQFSALELCF
jgi:hypothetical protein